MATVEEKQAMVAKLQAELQEVEDDKMVEGLIKDVEKGPWTYRNSVHNGKIMASTVNQKYGYFVIPQHVLAKLAKRLNLQYVGQEHFKDDESDYGGDNSCTYLVLGPPAKPECPTCSKCTTCNK